MDPVVEGLPIVLLGLLLCFLGVGSVHLAVLAAGFGLGWMVAGIFDADPGAALLVGLAGAIVAWVVATFVVKLAAFFVGIVTGAVIGAKVYDTLAGDSGNWALATIMIVAIAAACGFLADRYRARALLWLTTIGGAGIALSGLARAFPDQLALLRYPAPGWETVLSTLVWILLAGSGWLVQRRLFARRLRIGKDDEQRR